MGLPEGLDLQEKGEMGVRISQRPSLCYSPRQRMQVREVHAPGTSFHFIRV